jgi:hypothetical protein
LYVAIGYVLRISKATAAWAQNPAANASVRTQGIANV